MMMVMGWPIASAAVQPNIRSADAFHDMIFPVKSLLTIASSEDATIAAKRDGDSSGRNAIRAYYDPRFSPGAPVELRPSQWLKRTHPPRRTTLDSAACSRGLRLR